MLFKNVKRNKEENKEIFDYTYSFWPAIYKMKEKSKEYSEWIIKLSGFQLCFYLYKTFLYFPLSCFTLYSIGCMYIQNSFGLHRSLFFYPLHLSYAIFVYQHHFIARCHSNNTWLFFAHSRPPSLQFVIWWRDVTF